MPTLLLFSATILTSSFLIFLIQPMFAKMLLPVLGGAPQVWNTCMVFFQATLLLGYAYAHHGSSRLGLRRLAPIHLLVIATPLFILPFSASEIGLAPVDKNPSLWLLGQLILTVGAPFFALSTSGPLLQKWFSHTEHPHAEDPYFLNAVGSAGSILALLGYPLIVEVLLPLTDQSQYWTAAYIFLLVLISACLWKALKDKGSAHAENVQHTPPIAGKRKLRWIFLGFVPASLMLGVTSFLTADIAAAPLLWVIPLALYLLSFVMVFARNPILPHSWIMKALPFSVVALLGLMAFRMHHPMPLTMGLHLICFFVISLACHGELAKDRPPVDHLTGFYLLVALGGVLGGVFNAMASPVIFNTVFEYPLVVALAGLIHRNPNNREKLEWRDWVLGLAPMAYIAAASWIWISMENTGPLFNGMLATAGPLLVFCVLFMRSPLRFGLALAALLVSIQTSAKKEFGHALFTQRGFYGVHRVTYNEGENANILFHGVTAHGMQKKDPAAGRRPTGYYHYSGPAGQIFTELAPELKHIGIVGLGTGGLAGYVGQGQHLTFFELDPLVTAIAENPKYFSFLADAREAGARIDIQMGDARKSLENWSAPLDLLLLDAFNSDAIPMHLITREAVALYLEKVGPKGLIMFHISNHYLDFSGVLGDLAGALEVTALHQWSGLKTMQERRESKFPSEWVVMTRNTNILKQLRESGYDWRELKPRPEAQIQTDDFYNLFQVIR